MKKFFCLICLLLSSAAYNGQVFAASLGSMDPGAINRDYVREMRTYEAVSRAREKSAIVQKTQPDTAQTAASANLKSVHFTGNNVFSEQQLLPVIQSKIDSPMSPENIADIRKKIMKFYQSQGYYSVVANIVSMDVKTGSLVVEVIEGTKNSIVVE